MAAASIVIVGFALAAMKVDAGEAGCYMVSQTMQQWDTMYTTNYPPLSADPHYSGLGLAMHTSSYTMSAVGTMASTGVKDVAERGNFVNLTAEVNAAANAMMETTKPPVMLAGQATRLGHADFVLHVDSDMPMMSAITMIAPSPDWYAFGSTTLYENGAWQMKVVDFVAYDAGTDSGATYSPTPADTPTNPQVNIAELMSGVAGPSTTSTTRRIMFQLTFTPMCCYSLMQAEANRWVNVYNTNIPADAHYSRMVSVAHSSAYTMSSVGMAASNGIVAVAEMGNPTTLTGEIDAMVSSGATQAGMIHMPMIGAWQTAPFAVGNVAMSYANARYGPVPTMRPHMSFVTMIAPSPDWYAFGSAMIYNNMTNTYPTSTSVQMYAYDAGSDSSATYAHTNTATNPRDMITTLMSGVMPGTGPRHMFSMTVTPDLTCNRLLVTTTTILPSLTSSGITLSLGLLSWLGMAFAIATWPYQ